MYKLQEKLWFYFPQNTKSEKLFLLNNEIIVIFIHKNYAQSIYSNLHVSCQHMFAVIKYVFLIILYSYLKP